MEKLQYESRLLDGSNSFHEYGNLLPDRVRNLNKSVDMTCMLSRADLDIDMDPTAMKVRR